MGVTIVEPTGCGAAQGLFRQARAVRGAVLALTGGISGCAS